MSGKKTVHFVRHCQSTWNEAQHVFGLSHKDAALQSEAFLDAPLTKLGEEQAASIRDKIKALNAEVTITSPYTRTIETCLRSHGSQNVLVSHWCAERGESLCDIGNTKESLQEMYPMMDFSGLPASVWWYVDPSLKDQLTDQKKCYEWLINNGTFKMGEPDDNFDRRIDNFYTFLQSRSETNIVVFSHSMFLRKFFYKYFGRPAKQMLANGEVNTYNL